MKFYFFLASIFGAAASYYLLDAAKVQHRMQRLIEAGRIPTSQDWASLNFDIAGVTLSVTGATLCAVVAFIEKRK